MTENQKLSSSQNLKQEQNAFRFSLAMAISMTAIAAILVVTGGLPKGLLDLTALVIVVAVASLISTWLSRVGQRVLGILLLIGSLLFACIATAILFSGFGPVLAIVALIISFGAGSAALPRRYATLANTVSIVLALGFILLDVFEPFPRQPNAESTLTWIIAGALAVVFGLGILRNFSDYNFRTKLIISFIFMSVITLGILAVFNQNATTKILTENLGRELINQTETRATRIGDLLDAQINNLTILMVNELIEDSTSTSNAAYTGDDQTILAEIEQLDLQWRAAEAADNNNDPLLAEVLNHASVKELKEYQEISPGNIEVFFTDRYGALIGASQRTSDYYQADEAWWQAAYKAGEGAVYISDPEFDDSTGQFSILIAIPILDEDDGEVTGVMRTTYQLSFLSEILDAPIGETGRTDLFIPGDFPLNYPQYMHKGSFGPVKLSTYEQIVGVSDQPYAEMLYDGANSLISQAVVSSLGGNPVINDLDWFVVTHQQTDELFGPIETQTRTALGLVIIIVGVSAAIAVGLAQVLVAPISRLTATAQEITAGNLSIQADVTTRDEVGTLATTFNDMTTQLRNLLSSLEERVAARTRDLELAAEVGQRLSLVSETETMLAQAVEMIRERFDLYYTQVYLADPAGRALILRAGTGEVGQALLRRGHRLALDMTSLNGIAATERRTVLVEDTVSSTIHRPNPLLPDTRSEIAVPLQVGGRVVGVLDMQSEQPGALSQENRAAFEALAGSLAIAIANAELFVQAENARTTVENQARRLTSSGWQEFLDAIERSERFAFTYDRQNITPLTEAIPDSLGAGLNSPIQVVGVTVGKFHFERARAWTQDDHAIVQSVSRQVAQQIENMRLLAQAEQYQSEAQAALRRLTREGWVQYQEMLKDKQVGFLYSNYEVKPWAETETEAENALSFPIEVHDEIVGYLDIFGAEALSEDDAELVTDVNQQLSAHLENLRLSQQTQSALSQTETLYEIGRQLNLANNDDEILAALNNTALLIGCNQTSLMYIDQDSSGNPEWLSIVAGWSQERGENSPVGTRFPAAHFPLMSTLLANPNQPLLVPNVSQANHIDEGLRNRWLSNGMQAICMVPLGQAGQWLGLLTFSWAEAHAFSHQEEIIFDGLISLVTPVVQSRRLFEQAQTRAEREQALRQITAQVRTFVEPDMILRTAARELGDKLGRKVIIQMGSTQPNQPTPNDDPLDKAATS